MPLTLTARPIYRHTFDADADLWFGASGLGPLYNPATLTQDSQLGVAVSTGPWWVDPNHAGAGAGYLNLLALKSAAEAGVQDFTDLVFSFDLTTDDLQLPAGAKLYTFFQGIDQTIAWGNGDRVNYVNIANPITFDANGFAHVEVHYRAQSADWLALGSSFNRDDLYSVSAGIENALASSPLDFGVVIFLGNQLSTLATGSVSIDNVVISYADEFRAAVTTGAPPQLLGLQVDLADGEGLFDGGTLEISAAPGSTGILSMLGDPASGLVVDGSAIFLDDEEVAQIDPASDARHLIVGLTAPLADTQIERIISGIAFAAGGLAVGTVDPLHLSFTDSSAEEVGLDILVRVRAPIYDGSGDDEVFGTSADEALGGGDGSDILHGLGGNDLLRGGTGADQLVGGLGDDLYFVDDAGDEIVETSGEGAGDRVFAALSYTLTAGASIEIVSTTFNQGTESIDLNGNAFGQYIYGNAGSNRLDGKGGGDVLVGFEGNDFFYTRTSADRVVESAGGGSDRIFAAASFFLEANSAVEMITTIDNLATTAINLTGNNLAQHIYGNAGANSLDGNGGGDVLIGLEGDDLFYVRASADRVVESAGGGFDRIFAAVSFTLGANSAVEMITTIENLATTAINLTGNNLDQYIYGNAGSNRLDGGGGGDVLIGFEGNDFYVIRNAADRVVEAAGGGSDRVFAAASFTLEQGSQLEMLTTIDNLATNAIDLTGNELGQFLFGNAGANRLDGKTGADVLTGFGGADSFAFTTAPGGANIDRITDFSAADDTILLDDFVFPGLAPGALAPGAFVLGTQAADANDRILYDQATGRLFFDADGTGAGAAIHFATLDNHAAITAADFMVI